MSSIRALPRATRTRRSIAWIATAILLVAVSVAALMLGEVPVSTADVLNALTGGGDDGTRLVVIGWRLPRALIALIIGAMLGLSGALFQIITRNPFGSPDILGFSAGAYTGALLVIVAGGATAAGLAVGSLVGGVLAAAFVFGIVAWRGATGVRLIIVSIAMTAMLGAVNTMIQIAADDRLAYAAAIWGAGSLNGVDGGWVLPLALTLLAAAAATTALAPALTLSELGEDRASSLGVRPVWLRVAAMFIGVALIAVPIAAVGPISFVALAAPQIARRVWGSGPVPLAAAAASGRSASCSERPARDAAPGADRSPHRSHHHRPRRPLPRLGTHHRITKAELMRTDTPAWEATVTARTHVTPHMVRLTLGDIRSLGEGAFTSSGRADEFPGLWFQDGEGRVTKRYYSLRDVRADSRAVTIDFVVHGHGPGTEFGERARRGDLVRFDAPRGHYAPPADTTGILIAGDATALPAIGRILDERADGPRATVVVTVEGEEDKQALRVLPGDDLRWVQPNDMLATTLAAIDATGPSDYVWFSGEAADMRAVRKRLRHGLGRPVERWATMGYWRRDEERWVRAVLGHATLPAELEEIYSTETDTEVQRDLADALLERYGL